MEETRAWLETGYPLAQAEDDRIAITRLLAAPDISDALRAAAGTALDDNTPEALRHFLEVGRYEVGRWPVAGPTDHVAGAGHPASTPCPRAPGVAVRGDARLTVPAPGLSMSPAAPARDIGS